MNPPPAPDAVAVVIGVLAFVLVLVTPFVLSLVGLRRRSTNPKCTLAVAFLSGGGLLASLFSMGARMLEPHPVLAAIPGVIVFCGMLISLVLAIVGLTELRSRRWRHGQKRAIGVLVINGCFVLFLFAAMIVGLSRANLPGRPGSAFGPTAPAVFHGEKFGYNVNLSGTTWTRRWDTLATDSPAADFGIVNASGNGWLCVLPLSLGDGEVDRDTLTAAMLKRFTITFPNDAIQGLRDWSNGETEGRDFGLLHEHEGHEFFFRFRLLRRRGCAYLVAAWMGKTADPQFRLLTQGIDAVTLDSRGAPPRDTARLTEREQRYHSFMLNDIALALDNKGQSDAALPWLRRAIECSPGDTTLLANYAETCGKLGRHADALASLDASLAKSPGNHRLAAKRADVQFASGDTEGALKAYGALFRDGYRDDTQFAGYATQLNASGQTDTALQALASYRIGHETPALRRLHASLLTVTREFDRATDILLALQKEAPKDTETALALADCHFAAGRHTEALAECDKLIAANLDSAYLWRRKGFVEFGLKRYREAKASLEKAIAKDPANADLKRLLDVVSGQLGEGGNSLVKKTLEPVPVPAALLAAPSAEKAGAYLKGFSAYYVRTVTTIAFEKGVELKTTERQTVRVLDAQGVEKFSSLELSFDPLGEEIFVNSVLVKNPAGEVVSNVRVEDSYVVDKGGESATQHKLLRIPVPGLQPGFSIESTVTRRETGAADSFRFHTHQFTHTLPVLRSALLVVAPRDAVKWEATPGLPAPQRDAAGLTWIVEQPAVYRWEPVQAPAESFLPMVWLADAHADWPGEARVYLAQIKDRLPLDPAIQAAAAAATKGLTKDAEKTAALARFVQRELTYKAIEFGRRARIPAAATQTLRNKYGDCKDHALLLAQLLESAGISAHLALVSFSDALRPALPSLDQFDHMVVFLPGGKGGTFLDCTGKSGDLRASPPSGLATRQALILDPARPRLETIPDYAAGASAINSSRELSFPNESDLEVREDVTFTGLSATTMRASLLAVEAANRTRWLLQAMTRELPSVDLREAQIDNVDDPQTPLRLRLRYLVPRRFQAAGGQLIGQLPAVWERSFMAGDPVEQRQTPFRLWVPVSLESHVTLTPPAGWQATPTEARRLDRPFCTASATAQLDAHKLRLETRLTQRPGQFPAADYRAYLDATNTALSLVEPGIILKRDGK